MNPRQNRKIGRYCHVCRKTRPHEQFSGKGRGGFICKRCRQRVAKAEAQRRLERDEIFHYYQEQSNISAKNRARLEALSRSSCSDISELATLVLEAAKLAPYRRTRRKIIQQQRPDLFEKLIQRELETPDVDWDDPEPWEEDEDIPF